VRTPGSTRAPTTRTPSTRTRSSSGYVPRTRSSSGSGRVPGSAATGSRRYTPSASDARSVTRTVGTPRSSATTRRTPNNSNGNRTTTRRTPTTASNTTRRAPGERYRPTRSVSRPSPSSRAPSRATPTRRAPSTRRPSNTNRYASRPTRTPSASVRAPSLQPRTIAPRLGTPLTLTPSLRAPTAGRFTGRAGGIGTFVGRPTYSCTSNLFRGYYGGRFRSLSWLGNNCFYQPWSWGFGFNWGYSWCNPYSTWSYWNGPLTPYGAYQTSFWNSCYNDCYWNSWCRPSGLSWNFWWYPRSTYCPTWFYVPSSLVVIDGYGYGDAVDPPAEPVAASGGSVVASARSGEPDAGDDEASPTPTTLAKKYLELGDFYFENGRYDDAAKTYAKARTYLPDDAGIHFVLADAVFANGDYHYAAFLVAEGVRLDPTIVTATTDKRDFYGDKADLDAHMGALERHLEAKPYDAWAHLLMGYNLRFSDRPMQALASFRKVLELDAGNRAAQAFVDDLDAPKREAPAAPEAAPAKKTG